MSFAIRFSVSSAFCCFVVFIVFFSLNLKGSTFGLFDLSALSYVGSFLAFFGVLIRIVAIRTLKKDFDGYIQIKETQKLHTKGLYRFVRHPSYTGSILFFIGFGLSSLNVVTWGLFTLFIFWIYALRITYEEKILLEAFGEEYRNYQQRTSAFFPTYKTIKHLGGKYDVQKSRDNI